MRVSQPMNGNLFESITLLHISHTVIWNINRIKVISRIRKNMLIGCIRIKLQVSAWIEPDTSSIVLKASSSHNPYQLLFDHSLS